MSSGGHFKTVCPDCETVVAQCRCPSQDKAITYSLCEACAKKNVQTYRREDPPPQEKSN